MIRRIALLLALTCGPALAIDTAVKAPIEALDAGLVAAMRMGKAAAFGTRYAALAPLVERAFDLDTILQASVGPRWASFNPAQQQALRLEFTRFTVASYLANFNSFSGERFEVEAVGRTIGADQVVETKIIPTSGDSARIDYVMRQDGAEWHAVDVLLDGAISRAAVQRSDFRSLVETGPEPLIESLRARTAKLSGGAALP